jgi:prefoldin beta subunit
MGSEIPPQLQNQIAQLQQVQQQLQALSSQKVQVEMMLKETENALEELSKLPEGAVVYKGVGELLIKTDKERAEAELSEKKETLEVRIKAIERQVERLQERFQQLQEQVRSAIGAFQSSQAE